MDSQEVDNSMETFMTLFNKMFSETKYNLQALNKRMESMDKCFNNILLLTSDKPFDEINPENEEKNDENNENINTDNFSTIPKNIYNSYNYKKPKKPKGKITSKELDEIEKMFKDIDEPKENYNTFFVGKKRNNKKKEVAPLDPDPKSYYHDIQELLKNYSLDNDKEKDKKDLNNKKGEKINEENKKKKRGRKKKIIKDDEKSSESNADVDYLVPEKSDGYSKFKEFKELKKKMNNKKYGKYSDEEEIDDDIDSDF
jgi:hypothetical protein